MSSFPVCSAWEPGAGPLPARYHDGALERAGANFSTTGGAVRHRDGGVPELFLRELRVQSQCASNANRSMIAVSVDGTMPPDDPWGIMTSDATSQWPSPVSTTTDSLRSQMVDVAAELMRGTSGTPGSGFGADAADQSAMNLYLALMMDRLPVYAHTMINLQSQVGEGGVEQNLIPIGLATVQFYCEILAAKVTVLTKPDQVLQL